MDKNTAYRPSSRCTWPFPVGSGTSTHSLSWLSLSYPWVVTYPRCNLLVAYLVVHSFPAVEPVEPIAEPVTKPVTEPAPELTAEPGRIAISKVFSKRRTILLALFRHRKQ